MVCEVALQVICYMEISKDVEQKGVLEKGGGFCLFLNVPCSTFIIMVSHFLEK